jgi:hypothetical protein
MKSRVRDEPEDAKVTARIGHDRFHPTVRAAVDGGASVRD